MDKEKYNVTILLFRQENDGIVVYLSGFLKANKALEIRNVIFEILEKDCICFPLDSFCCPRHTSLITKRKKTPIIDRKDFIAMSFKWEKLKIPNICFKKQY